MPKSSGLGDRFYVEGNDISGDVGALGTISGTRDTLDDTGIDKLAVERLIGMADGEIAGTAWFNPTGAHPVLASLPTASVHFMYAHGDSLGDWAANIYGKQINYDPTRAENGALSLAFTAQAAEGAPLEWGQLFSDGKETQTGPTDGASIDFGAASTDGGRAYIHVFSLTGADITIAVQESVDDAVFNDVLTAPFTGSPGAVAVVPASPNLSRYMRLRTTGTFTNAVIAVSFLRREAPEG